METVLKGVVESVSDTGNTWTSKQGKTFKIYNVEIAVDGKIYAGSTMSGKFKEGSEAEFTAEDDSYSPGRYKIKYHSAPYTGGNNYNKGSMKNDKNGSFAVAYAKDIIVALIEKGTIATSKEAVELMEAVGKKIHNQIITLNKSE